MSGVSHEIETLFRAGAAQASRALAAWLDRPASLVVERLESLARARLGDRLARPAAAAAHP